jgi:cytoskeleton protein RodZ
MQTIGERLEEARKKKGISIREAAEATKIRGDYLQRFESNQFDIGLNELYTRGFLRNYANFLKLPADRILNDYAALGRGDVRPRQPSREVYGRMDVTMATAEEVTPRATPPPAESPAPAAEPAAPRAAPGRYPRGGASSLPTGPDPATIFKWAKIGGAVVLALVLLLVIKSLVGGGGSTAKPAAATRSSTPATTAAHEPSVTLVATNDVRVTVEKRNPDGTRSELLFERTLSRGEVASVPRTGEIFITASAAQNLTLVINGRSFPMAAQPGLGEGYQVARIEGPKS